MLKKDLMRHEFIGLEMNIIDAKNSSLKGMKGKIIDETKNTFTIKNHTMKKIIKGQVIFTVKIKHQTFTFEGATLLDKSEDRLKK